MRMKRWMGRVGRGPRPSLVLAPLLLRGHLPAVPAPRESEGRLPWRPVLFGLGAVVGFAVALGRSRKVLAPGARSGATSTATSSGRAEGGISRAIHLPAPLTESIEAELTPDGPVLFSPPDAIDPIGAEALEADANGAGKIEP